MTTREINEKREFMFGNGLLNYKVDMEELKQNIITTIRSFKNDCFFDLDAGIDWKTYLSNYGTEKEIKEDIIRNVKKIEGVVGVVNYNSFLENRKLVITMTVQSIYGNININNGELTI